MLTGIITYHGNDEDFLRTANLFYKQKVSKSVPKRTQDFLQLIVLDKTGDIKDSEKLSLFFRKYGNTVFCLDASQINMAQASNLAVSQVNGHYVVFLSSGDVFSESALKLMMDFLEKTKDEFLFVSPNISYYSRDQKTFISHFPATAPVVIPLEKMPTLAPLTFSGIMVRTTTLKEYTFNEQLPYDYGLNLIYRFLRKKAEYPYIKKAAFRATESLEAEITSSQHAMDKEWYWGNIQNFLLPLMYAYLVEEKKIPAYLQLFAQYQLKWRFRLNANNATKHVVDDEVDEFFKLCTWILQHVDTKILLTTNRTFALPLGLKDVFLRLKNKQEGLTGYEPKYFSYGGTSYLEHEGHLIHKISDAKLLLELLEFDATHLVLEGSLENYIDFSRCKLNAFFDKKPVKVETTYRYAHTKFFGKSVHKRHTFRIKIPRNSLGTSLKLIGFEIDLMNGQKIVPSIITKRYTAKLSSAFSGSYWKSNGYLLRFTNNKKFIKITKSNFFNSIKSEFKYFKSMLSGRNKSSEMLFLRAMYWITYPYFKNKRIWLTYDKLYKGGDCGEYFYKYASTRSDGIESVYVINHGTPDSQRLAKEGYSPLLHGTLKHKLYFLNAEVVFSTHGGVYNFNDFDDSEVIYIQNILKADVCCIQHGLTVQQLAHNSNKIFNNIVRYYCASKYEVENLSHPVYGYEDKTALKITGIPRYDGLVNSDKKQILITPTWRNYIAMPAVEKNAAKPYFKGFKETDYFKIYERLISDERLVSVANKFGYKIIYLLHPVISAQINDYPKCEGVDIVPATSIDYEKILTESSLMVTDYSGVQFDFAYMRKPVVYYHPDELPPHYKEGGFFYDSMGFGEICKKHEEIVDLICSYMESDCAVKPFYLERQDDFFAFNDLNSCQRIYDDMLEYQNAKKFSIE